MEQKETLTYDQAMKRLEDMADAMERGDTPIDQMEAQLREARELLAQCKRRLTLTEEAVNRVTTDNDEWQNL